MPAPVQDEAQNRLLAEEIYDMLMSDIEPDLLTKNLPTLDSKYAGETAEEKQNRLARYQVAYKRFDEEFASFMNDVDDRVRAGKRQALQSKEEQAKSEEAQVLSSLTSAFQ